MSMLAVWQGLESDSISAGNTRLLMIFVGLVAFSMLVQAVVVVVVALGAKKAQTRALQIFEELHARAIPIINSTEEIIQDATPKIKTISANLLETSEVVRAKAKDLESTITDANSRTKAQVARVDSMVSTALTATGSLAAMIHHGIRTPVVEAVGVVNGFKAGLDVLLSKSRGPNGAQRVRKTGISLYKGNAPDA